MEFQSGPDAPLKPVEIVALQEAPSTVMLLFRSRRQEAIFLMVVGDQG